MDGDGRDDVITGQYWPGDVFLFRGLEGGGFAPVETLKDETGRSLNAGAPWIKPADPNLDSLAAAPFAADFDGDGDRDVLIGNISGNVVLMTNTGGKERPLFSTKRVKLQAGGARIVAPGGDAGPLLADWDRDGKRDLLVGAGDGSVWLYRNEGEDSAPRFAPGVTLVEPSQGGFDSYPHGGNPAGPGARAKVCVTDFDGDGWDDLLLGDYASELGPPLQLDTDQVRRRDELRAQRDAVYEEYGKYADDDVPAELVRRIGKIQEELFPLEEHDISHGFVWLFRRVPPAPAAAGGTAPKTGSR
jgi:hypothetical protein